MRFVNNYNYDLLLANPIANIGATDMSSTITGKALLLRDGLNFSVFLKWSGTPTGAFKLQCSNDNCGTEAEPTDWEDVTGSSYLVSGAAGQLVFNYDTAPFRWLRVVYTATSGSGTLTKATFNLKGN